MKLHLAIMALIFLLPIKSAPAAITVTSCTLANPSFGKISAGTSGSTSFGVKTNTAAGTTIGGNGKMIATGRNATLTINTTGTGDKLKVFVTTANFNMTKTGGTAIASRMSFSNTSSTTTTFTTTNQIRTSPATTTITIFGYSTIGANQNAGTYSGNYQLVVCRCAGNTCPTASTDSKCTATPACTVSGPPAL
jgi:hypothetical protein